jgi:hypothetical protein
MSSIEDEPGVHMQVGLRAGPQPGQIARLKRVLKR